METPPVPKFFHEEIGKFDAHVFQPCFQNSIARLLKQNSRLWRLHRAATWLFFTPCKRKCVIFELFQHISRSFQYFYEILFGSKISLDSSDRHQKRSCYPWIEAESPDFGNIFKRFLRFWSCPFWQNPLNQDNNFWRNFSSSYVLWRVVKGF